MGTDIESPIFAGVGTRRGDTRARRHPTGRFIGDGFATRILAVFIGLAIISTAAPAGAQRNLTGADPWRCDSHQSRAGAGSRPGTSPAEPSCSPGNPVITPANTQASAEAPLEVRPALSAQARTVSEIANRSGDRTYLMVDKNRGEIFLFENGQPIFRATALTGMSPADHLPPGAIDAPFSRNPRLEDKITPAGRYTVSRGHDDTYGTVFSINEIQGDDWDIAIHLVFLGLPAERRAERLRSPSGDDRHITWGCIDVDQSTVRFLDQRLTGNRATPIYILPHDESRTMAFFAPARSLTSAAGRAN